MGPGLKIGRSRGYFAGRARRVDTMLLEPKETPKVGI